MSLCTGCGADPDQGETHERDCPRFAAARRGGIHEGRERTPALPAGVALIWYCRKCGCANDLPPEHVRAHDAWTTIGVACQKCKKINEMCRAYVAQLTTRTACQGPDPKPQPV